MIGKVRNFEFPFFEKTPKFTLHNLRGKSQISGFFGQKNGSYARKNKKSTFFGTQNAIFKKMKCTIMPRKVHPKKFLAKNIFSQKFVVTPLTKTRYY